MRSRRLAAWILAAILLSGCGGNSREGNKAPDFSLRAINRNRQITLSEINKEKPVLLIFWATWCPSCIEEIPVLNAIYKERYDHLKVIGINVQEPLDAVQKFMKQNRMEYPVLWDESGETALKYGLEGLPTSVLLAKGGEILYYGFSIPGNLDALLETKEKL